MDNENKIILQQNIIKDLRKENEELRKINEDLSFQLNYEKENHKNSLQKARELIESCKATKDVYDKCIKETSVLKEQYKNATDEINQIKKQYNKEIKRLLKNFSKSLT